MYSFIKQNEKTYCIEENKFMFRKVAVGEIVLNDSNVEIIFKKELPFYDQVELFKEVVDRFKEIKENNMEVRFVEMTQQEVFAEKYVDGKYVFV